MLYKNLCGWRCFAELRSPLLKDNTLTLTPAMPWLLKAVSRTKPSLHYKHMVIPTSLSTHKMDLLCVFCTFYPIFLHVLHSLIFVFFFLTSAFLIFVESFAFIFISLCCQASLAFQGSSCTPPPGFQKFDTACPDHPCPASSKSILKAFLQVISNFLL